MITRHGDFPWTAEESHSGISRSRNFANNGEIGAIKPNLAIRYNGSQTLCAQQVHLWTTRRYHLGGEEGSIQTPGC